MSSAFSPATQTLNAEDAEDAEERGVKILEV